MGFDAFNRRGAVLSVEHRCPVCGAKPGEQCRNTIKPGQPLPGRDMHYARRLK